MNERKSKSLKYPRFTSDDFKMLVKINKELKEFERKNQRTKEKYNLD